MASNAAKALCIIAGAGTGTGASLAHAFARKGFAVALLARTQSKLDTITKEVQSQGGTAASFVTDLSKRESIESAFQNIRKQFPDSPVKVAIMNGGGGYIVKPFLEIDHSEWSHILESRVLGAVTFSQLSIKAIQEHNTGGTLLFSGATASLRGSAKFSLLAANCFAVRALSQSLAREFQPQGIHVAHAVIDGTMTHTYRFASTHILTGIIDTEQVRTILPSEQNAESGHRLSPDAIANASPLFAFGCFSDTSLGIRLSARARQKFLDARAGPQVIFLLNSLCPI